MEIAIIINIFIIVLAVIISFIRFVKGPAVTDRILSLDVITVMITAMLVLLSLLFDRSIYIDVALMFGVVGFVGVVVFGRFLEKGV